MPHRSNRQHRCQTYVRISGSRSTVALTVGRSRRPAVCRGLPHPGRRTGVTRSHRAAGARPRTGCPSPRSESDSSAPGVGCASRLGGRWCLTTATAGGEGRGQRSPTERVAADPRAGPSRGRRASRAFGARPLRSARSPRRRYLTPPVGGESLRRRVTAPRPVPGPVGRRSRPAVGARPSRPTCDDPRSRAATLSAGTPPPRSAGAPHRGRRQSSSSVPASIISRVWEYIRAM